jgi:uncharacterized lipoprotein YehR (DUF1307 family)
MKNAVKLLFVAVVMVAFTACGGKTETTTETQDTVKTEVTAAPDTTQAADTTKAAQ